MKVESEVLVMIDGIDVVSSVVSVLVSVSTLVTGSLLESSVIIVSVSVVM